METIGERIKRIRKELCLSQKEFASGIGIGFRTLTRYERNDRLPDSSIIVNIAHMGNVTTDWLLTGEGEMPVKGLPPSNAEIQPQTEHVADCYAYLPLYDMSASAGGGFCATDQEEVKTLLAFKKDWIHNELLVNPEELFLVHVEGESMTPVLNPGDVILGKKQNGAPVKDGIHVVRLDDVILVKRVQRLPGGKIKISSDNKAYEPYTLDLAEIDNFAVIGRVVWAGRRF